MNERHGEKISRWAREGKTGGTPVAAATVILLRDTPHGLETLMLRRHSKIAFGGMWVFPGGRVDDADRDGLDATDELAAARCAATREAAEETGLILDVTDLLPLSHWTPPAVTPRRFLTWFFLSKAPAGKVQIDQGEIQEHAWMPPAEAFSQRQAGQIELAPPTFVTLHYLAGFSNVSDAMSCTANCKPEHFETALALGDNGPIALWQGDSGYDTKDVNSNGARHRLSMEKHQWRYERS
ncbi:MAG: NUDIX hydrolase [Oceanococcus sp.]